MVDHDYPKEIKEQDDELSELDARMKTDADLLYLKSYVMESQPDIEGKRHVIPGIVNATLNKPAVFGANVVSALGSVKEQVIVESEDPQFDTHQLEQFYQAALMAANTRLMKSGAALLNPFADAQFCFRGRTARRILFREEDGIFIPDITNWDGRYFRYQIGNDGLEWAALKMTRSKQAIEEEYGIVIEEREGMVLDVWDKEHNEVWVDNKRVSRNKDGKSRNEEHSYGYVPVVFQIVPLGYGNILMDRGNRKNEGESIFFLIRDIIPQLNMMISIWSTLNFLSVKKPIQTPSLEGKTAEPPEYDKVMRPGASVSVDPSNLIQTIDYGDAIRATELLNQKLEQALQEGSYTDIDIGNVRQPFSAVALITIGESRDQVFMPRLASKELLNKATAEMFIKQCLAIGGTLRFGEEGDNRKFSSAILDGEYHIGYRYFIKDPKRDIARMAQAQQAKEWYPRKYIYSEVLQVEDPDGLERDWYSELAAQIDPNILKHRIIMSLLDKADEGDEDAAREAMIMAMGMGISVEQMKAGIMPEIPKITTSPESGIQLLPEGGRVGGTIPSSAKKAGELTQTPRERSEEHTSELQSQSNLVCRLL